MWDFKIMKSENIYKVTLVSGPVSAIIPIKAYDASHAVRIASTHHLGMVVKVELACEKSDS